MPRIPQRAVTAVRRFNRAYTRHIGALDRAYLQSPFSLAEVRVLYELAHRSQSPTASELCADLGLDPGYLSRLLRAFERGKLIRRERSVEDGRREHLSLTASGKRAFAPLERRASAGAAELLGRVPATVRAGVLSAFGAIERALTPNGPEPREKFSVRTHRPGDMGWVIHRHGRLYHEEFGYDARFEALVARICADFIDEFDPTGDQCWIAERDGEILGSVFCVRKSATVAKLRLLLVEPSARGLGVGTRLVDECIRFARERGYKRLTLWTQSHLGAARRIYERAGFRLTHQEKHVSFGKRLVAQTWDLAL